MRSPLLSVGDLLPSEMTFSKVTQGIQTDADTTFEDAFGILGG